MISPTSRRRPMRRQECGRVSDLIRRGLPADRAWPGVRAPSDGNVVPFLQNSNKFNTIYATLGFSDKANLNEAAVWPVAFALKELTGAVEARIRALVKKAVS